jgi:type I restriction enzyme S subunit
MAGEWKKATIDQLKATSPNAIAMGPFGSRIKTDNFVPSGVPIIRGGNLNAARLLEEEFVFLTEEKADELRASNAWPGDIVITHRGTLGQVGIIPYDSRYPRYVVSQSQMKLTVDPAKADPYFIYYYLRSPIGLHQLLSNTSQVGVPAIAQPTSSLKAIEISLPVDVDEQRSIVHILRTLDDKIELNRRMNETLEAIARAVFKSWFVDFDPVRAKASGEPPESICRRLGLTPDLLALFPDRLVDSEFGEIPEGWEIGSIADHCYLNAESWTAKTLPEKLHYVDLANAKNGEISEVQVFSSSAAPSRARRVLRSGDTIVGTVRPGNRSFALIGEGVPQLTGSTGFAVLSPRRPELRELVYFLATSDENIDRLSRLADGAAYPAVRPEVVTAGTCVVPTPDVIGTFHGTIVAMIDYQMANQINSNTLASTRDALLPKLLSGELKSFRQTEMTEAV